MVESAEKSDVAAADVPSAESPATEGQASHSHEHTFHSHHHTAYHPPQSDDFWRNPIAWWNSGDGVGKFRRPWYHPEHFPQHVIRHDDLKLTEKDFQVMREIRHGAIWHRGLPVGLAAVAGVFLLRRKFDHVRRFSALYSIVGFIAGFGYGARSYRSYAFEEIKKLDTDLGARIRQIEEYQLKAWKAFDKAEIARELKEEKEDLEKDIQEMKKEVVEAEQEMVKELKEKYGK